MKVSSKSLVMRIDHCLAAVTDLAGSLDGIDARRRTLLRGAIARMVVELHDAKIAVVGFAVDSLDDDTTT